GLLQRDGDVVDVDGQSPLRFNNLNFGSYHVAVRHRNHLGLMTKNTIVIDPFYATPVDLANRESLSYGKDASISLMNSRALWGGDLNSDRNSIYQGPKNDIGNLFLDVISDVENFGHLPNYIKRGYETTDFDLDGKAIFQGPDNDRAKLLLEVVLRNPRNILKISNFIVDEVLPKKN
ncbi:MAG TPA: hypothetical protein PKC40_11495, partial [Saprospiraceae bacterium]|nr:hypothetical protein [Saprospiraceae bacterium]